MSYAYSIVADEIGNTKKLAPIMKELVSETF